MHDEINNGTVIKNSTKETVHSKQWHLVWYYVIMFTLLHIGSGYGIYLIITKAKWQTNLFAYFLYIMCTLGVTAGAHRLWSHRSYKAKLPLKIILLFFQTMSFQTTVSNWVSMHRVHHKYCDTDADPHNSTRGFFFSHIGWALLEDHPEVKAKQQDIDLKDIEADKLLCFQKKYYNILSLLICFIAPTYFPVLWNEEKLTAFWLAVILRLTITYHAIFFINSAAHMWGTKPYDKNIQPVETKAVSLIACGEGFHNYHHTFPWDYKAAEFGGYSLNTSRLFIDIMAKIGWAYDLRTVSQEMIQKRVVRTGDGTHPHRQFHKE